MTLEQFLAAHHAERGWTWNRDGDTIQPTEQDFRQTLDEAARLLYAETDTGRNMLQLGRLLIIREDDNFYVYVLAGQF